MGAHMKKIHLICFVITLFRLTFNGSVWARDGHHYGHRKNTGGLVLGLAVGSALRYGLNYTGHSIYNGYGQHYYLPYSAHPPAAAAPKIPQR